MKAKQIYLDSHASTPLDQDVLSAMLPFFTEFYGNGNHKSGWKTNAALENARFQVSNFIGAKPSEITFTSGATEAINMALLGLAKANTSDRNHIVTQRTEHKVVLQCVDALEKQGYKVTMLEVDEVGRINLDELKQVVTNKTLVVAIMLANNEIGTVQPIETIGNICKNNDAKFFCDITQGMGWFPINMKKLNIDLAALTAHKFYGPRGIGALYIKKTNPRIAIAPILFGGGQENGLRPGTSNVPAIVGLGKACELLQINGEQTYRKIEDMRNRLQKQLFSAIEGIKLNGCPINRHPGNLNISIPSISGEQLKGLLPNVMFSTSSACSSSSSKPSHVLSALHIDNETVTSSFRLGINKYNTNEEIDFVARKIIEITNNIN